MEWIEVTARTLPEAVDLALDRLGVVEDELEYEVLDEPRSGLFGLGRTDARIRARVKPLSREKPADRRRRRPRGAERSERRPSGRGAAGRGASSRDRETEPTPKPAGTPAAPRASGNRNRRPRSRGGARNSRPNGAGQGTEDNAVDHDATLPIEEQAAAAVRFTEELMRHFGADAAVGSEIVEDDIEVRVEGTGLGVLVGPKGATLHALEEIVRAVVQHAAGGHSARLRLDVADYRQQRREAMAAFVTKIADEVRASGVDRALEPMTAPDRKVVHDTVAELDGVSTISEGEEPRRRVVIRPG
ncbi:MAG: RNA-binding cell elongation regulator Jag/EloR [Actinomycetota bacterium]